MTYLKYFSVLFLVMVLSASCKKEDDNEFVMRNYDCVFEQDDDTMDGIIDDNERMIMNECITNAISSKASIESNLVGEWELIGHGQGWLPNISQPCGYITITQEELTFEFRSAYVDTIITHVWEVEAVQGGPTEYFRLSLGTDYVEGLWITQFCPNYMFGDQTPVDGNMYLYQKVQ